MRRAQMPRFAVLAGFVALLAFSTVRAAPGEDVKKLAEGLKKAIAANNTEQIQHALEALIDLGGSNACGEVVDLLPKLGPASDDTYWQLISAGSGFRDQQAL